MTLQINLLNETTPIQQSHWTISPRTKEALKTAAYVLANIAIIGSLIAVTVLFPHVMVPVWIGTGALLAFYGIIFALFVRYVVNASK
jgi:hypothetical protein